MCADFFHYRCVNYFITDRYSNWLIVERSTNGSKGLIDSLRKTFEIHDKLTSDGGPEFTATTTKTFKDSSFAFPHSNCRTEAGVKTVKHLLLTTQD